MAEGAVTLRDTDVYWITHALTFMAGGAIGATAMACLQINRMQDDFNRRDDRLDDDLCGLHPDRRDRDRLV
jgi:hypothetical protein